MMRLTSTLGQYSGAVTAALEGMASARIVARIWDRDHTVWKDSPAEISNRLGWLTVAERMKPSLPRLTGFAGEVRGAGYRNALLLGMGGSSLAPEVFRRTFGLLPRALDLAVLDSTAPAAVAAFRDRLKPAQTLYIVSTKSGGTVETFSFFKTFYHHVLATLGPDAAGDHFIAITDPGSDLDKQARRLAFRTVFLNDPEIGGRYSVLSFFGLAPAAIAGVDPETLISRADEAINACGRKVAAPKNPGAVLGAIMGVLAKQGRDKATFIISDALAAFGDWVEQLIAESTGKEGRGILPVVNEPLAAPKQYGADRLFVHLRLDGDDSQDAAVKALEASGHPVVRLALRDAYDLGAQFFLWEFATAVAGHVLAINPFDQPNVEAAKVLARQMVAAYKEKGKLPAPTPAVREGGISVFGEVSAPDLAGALASLLDPKAGGYVCLQAYLPPSAAVGKALASMRARIAARTGLAVTAGYGPRFLHSTGQLHKGDAGHGRFIQFTAESGPDLAIPDEAGSDASSLSFAPLVIAQAMGDGEALRNAGRKVIRIHLGKDILAGLKKIAAAI
jgi:transaldolase / glucose-6-phosphate isomerase